MGDFAIAYADQAEHCHAVLKATVSSGTIKLHIKEDQVTPTELRP